MEVACEHDSALATAVQNARNDPRAASRCALWNSADVGTNEGLRLILDRVSSERPRHVWITPPVGAFSQAQNMHQQSTEQKGELAQKRQQAMKVLIGVQCIIYECMRLGSHVTVEMPARSNAWRLPMVQAIRKHFEMKTCRTQGCRVNLRDGRGRVMQHGWQMMTSNPRLAQVMEMPCRCAPNTTHGRVLHEHGRSNPKYTPEFVKRAVSVLCQELSHPEVQQECRGSSELPVLFGQSQDCSCAHQKGNQWQVTCGVCHQLRSQEPISEPRSSKPEPKAHPSDPEAEACQWNTSEVEEIERKALELLQQSNITYQQLEKFLHQLEGLPMSKRRMFRGTGAQSMIFGMYAYGSQQGITNRTKQLPNTCRVMNKFFKDKLPPSATWNAIVVNKNCKAPIHKDHMNESPSKNWLCGLGAYEGGELWVETPPDNRGPKALAQEREYGAPIQGRLVETRHRVVEFSAQAWHGTCPWKGDKWTLTAYTSRREALLGDQEHDSLRTHGFPVQHQIPQQQALANEAGQPSSPSRNRREQDERIKRQLYLLHAATGHGSVKHLVEALRRRGVSERTLELAKEFQCSVCLERRRIGSRPLATLEPLPPKLSTVSADIGHWTNPHTGEAAQFLLAIDEGSRFRVARILTKGVKQTPSAAACLQYFQEGWCQYFGYPRVLRLDPSGPFRSHAVEAFCDKHKIHLEVIPGEAHHQIGVCEQAVGGVKELMTKVSNREPELSTEEAPALAISVFNQREQIRGFTPAQHILGQNLDLM